MKIYALWAALALLGISGLATAQSLIVGCVASGGTNCPARIPDSPQTGITSSIVVPASAATFCPATSPASISVQLNVTHSAVGDLSIALANPALSSSTLLANLQGAAGACQGSDIVATFTDVAGSPPTCSALIPSVSGIVKPVTLLSPLGTATGAPSGTWNLTLTDTANNGDGALNDWALVVTCISPPVPGEIPRSALAWMILALALVGFLALRRTRRISDRS